MDFHIAPKNLLIISLVSRKLFVSMVTRAKCNLKESSYSQQHLYYIEKTYPLPMQSDLTCQLVGWSCFPEHIMPRVSCSRPKEEITGNKGSLRILTVRIATKETEEFYCLLGRIPVQASF